MNFRNKIIGFVLIALGIIGALDFAYLYLSGLATNLGNVLPGVLGAVFIIIGSFMLITGRNIFLIRNIYMRNALIIIVVLFVCSFIIIETLIFYSAKENKTDDVDFVMILGAGLKGDRITATFKNRLDMGYDYLIKNQRVKVIVTGGKGIGETITEAEAMKKYLVNKGIDENRIIMEDKATSTMENFKYSKKLLPLSTKKYSIMIVTSDFHLFRSKILARRNRFIPYGLPAKTWSGVFINSCIREYFAVIKSLVIDW